MYDKEKIEPAIDKVLAEMSDVEKTAMVGELNDELTMELPDGKVITFNTEQYRGIVKIRKWLKGKEQFFTLAGYAGTGKTTIIKKIIDEFRGRIVVSAPTHKAKKVIMMITQEDGETLHALLGLSPDLNLDEFNPNKPIFNPISDPKMGTYNLVVIDEASMINEDLYELIKKEAAHWKQVKILFMGDHAQIPPIGEKKSIVFDTKEIELHQLTQIMRQEENNPLAVIYSELRNNLSDVYGGFSRVSAVNADNEGVVFTKNKNQFRDRLIEIFTSDEYAGNMDYAKLIAWRNVTVMQSNDIIRKAIFGEHANILEANEVLMAYRSIRARQQFFNLIDNSADYKVMRVSDQQKNEFGLDGFKVNIRELLPTGKYMYRNIFILDHRDFDNLHTYAEIHDGLKTIAKNTKHKNDWRKYYAFRRESLLMVKIIKFRDGSLRESDETIVKDLDYGYAITGHKAQGSTYEHVFVLEDDISMNSKTKERNQIKYVALTRPKKTATVLTSMP